MILGLGCLLVTATVAILATIIGRRTHSSVADWLNALATLGALVAAFVAATFAAGAFRLERWREDQWSRNKATEQASMIAAWAAVDVRHDEIEAGDTELTVMVSPKISLRNGSQLPVYAVHVVPFMVPGIPEAEATVGVLSEQHLLVLPPAETVVIEMYPQHFRQVIENDQAGHFTGTRARVDVTVNFRDAAGLAWCRSADGRLGPSHMGAFPRRR